jgi:hypothetical protein
MLDLSKRPNTLGVSIPTSEDRNRSSFRNVVFSSYLEFRTMKSRHRNPVTLNVIDHHQKPSDYTYRNLLGKFEGKQ